MLTAMSRTVKAGVDGHANLQAMDRLTGLPDAVTRDLERHTLGVEQFALDVPQAVVAAVAVEHGGAGVLGRAGGGRRKRQGRLLCWTGRSKDQREGVDCPGSRADGLSRAGVAVAGWGARLPGRSTGFQGAPDVQFLDKMGETLRVKVIVSYQKCTECCRQILPGD
jgi:hypothetical protein